MLQIRDLSVTYGDTLALNGLSFEVRRGEVYALVGESGCGKTTAALALMRYLPRGGRIISGCIAINGTDVLQLDDTSLRSMRGSTMAMVYQNPASALNPSMTVGAQVEEVFAAHHARDARARAIDMFRQVQLPRAEYVFGRYPHQLSGGMQQRIVIAIALASNPRLLVLDEPTTGLDATVEAGVLDLIVELQRERGMAILFITHNLSIVRRLADRVGVLYAGQLMEEGLTADVFAASANPYTRGLLASAPRLGARRGLSPLRAIPGQVPSRGDRPTGCVFAPRCSFRRATCFEVSPIPLSVPGRVGLSRCHFVDEVLASSTVAAASEAADSNGWRIVEGGDLLLLEDARKTFRAGGSTTVALDGVSLTIQRGETFGLVGESGSGKSTLARAVAGLEKLDSGSASLDGESLGRPAEQRRTSLLQRLQMVFQDPESTLNPAHTVGTILDRSLKRLTQLDGPERARRLADLMDAIQLDRALLGARPGELSGGQKQRVAIARAFAPNPELVLCDEPVSSLDVSVQAAILTLLDTLQRTQSVSYLFISHDIAVVRYLADHVGVMYAGRLVEVGPADAVFSPPHHPYTALLLTAAALAPVADSTEGAGVAKGCPFAARCPRKIDGLCEIESPPWRETPAGEQIRCHIPIDQL